MRIVALVQTYNERRHIARCIEHHRDQGADVYVVDNESTDETIGIVERYLGRGVIGLETLPRRRGRDLRDSLQRKQELACTLDADWLIHLDADERRCSSDPRQSLGDALRVADEAGFNAVNFLEFVFVPTIEAPDHDHPDYERTMRSYYHFLPGYPHRLNAFKRQDGPVDLASSGGHRVAFEGRRLAPRNLSMRHYRFLSLDQFRTKYPDTDELVAPAGHENWDSSRIAPTGLLSERHLRRYRPGEPLDRSEPLTRHPLSG